MTGVDAFEVRRGPDAFGIGGGVVAGMLAGLRETGNEIVPTLVASALSGAPLTADCYQQLKTELLERLKAALPVDGVLMALHGAGAVADGVDLEGDLLEAVRGVAGGIPIVGTLDLHAHVTEAMVHSANALLAWETYPHNDTFQTGVRGANLMHAILSGQAKPAMALAKVPVIVGAFHGSTEGEGPFADIMRFAKSLEHRDGVLSTSAFLVQPYLDMAGMGGGGLVVTDGNPKLAAALAGEIAARYWGRRYDLEPRLFSPAEGIARGLEIEGGPVLLLELADCCGGGAAGDSVATLRALIESGIDAPALVPVVDAEAAELCHRAGEGQEIELQLGHKVDPQWGSPVPVMARILKLTDGRFTFSGGIWGGQEAHMGPSAAIQVGAVTVLVASRATYDWADEQFQSMGLAARDMKFVVVKNPMNYRRRYGDMARAAIPLDTPGPTPATLKHMQFKRLKRPYFPADPEIADVQPTVMTSVNTDLSNS